MAECYHHLQWSQQCLSSALLLQQLCTLCGPGRQQQRQPAQLLIHMKRTRMESQKVLGSEIEQRKIFGNLLD